MAEKRRRRWYQYSLKAMLLFILVFSILMSWLGVALRQARHQLRAANAITEAGGTVGYVDVDTKAPEWLRKLLGEELFRNLVHVSLAGTHADDSVLEHLDGVTAVKTIYLDGTQATDTGLAYLTSSTGLETVYLDGTQVTDAGLEQLEGMTSLRTLSLGGTQVTGTGLAHLAQSTSLTTLYLGGTQLNDASLKHVVAIKSLDSLYLDGAPITDNGLEHFEGLANLRKLRLDGTLVTNEGVDNLREALPRCTIVHWRPSDTAPGRASQPLAVPTTWPRVPPTGPGVRPAARQPFSSP